MKARIHTLAALCGVMTLVYFINLILFSNALNQWGIYPRQLDGLWGIAFSPFLHGNLLHLLGNLIAFAIFSLLVMLHGLRYFWLSSLIIIACGGLGVWLFARGNYHIGASGWIFGLWALSIANAWYKRSVKNLLIAAIVIIFWGGMVFGLLPRNPYISFEAHIFGAIGGILAAAGLKNKY